MRSRKNRIAICRLLVAYLFIVSPLLCTAQDINPEVLTYTEFLGYVKKYYPRVRQANLEVSKAQAELMTARGAFDPKLEVDFETKEFKDQEYYSLLNSSFKIPTWYGIEIKAGFDNAEGIYVNPQNTLPNSGLTSLGINIPLGQGLLINQRMADLRVSKIQINLSEAAQQLQAVEAIHDASVAYFNWIRAYDQAALYNAYYNFANIRYKGIQKSIELGDKAAIDSVEAGIVVKNRLLNVEEARLKLIKSRLELSNFLWIENIPVELQDNIIPDSNAERTVKEDLGLVAFETVPTNLENHPKIQSLTAKLEILTIERKLKANLLLPKVDLGYYYLSEPSSFDDYRFQDYKVGVNFSFPLFLRKERGNLKFTKLKIQESQLDLDLERLQLKNKIEANQNELEALQRQIEVTNSLVNDYGKMLESEERLFSYGESSIFLINSRENNLVNSSIARINLQNELLNANAALYLVLAGLPAP